MTDNNNPNIPFVEAPVTVSTDGDEVFRVVTTSAITQVEQVRCYDETLEHIASEHPEFTNFVPSLEHAVHDTIAAPTSVLASNSAIHANSYKYVSERHSRGNSHLVVAVKVLEGTSGLLKTAYFTGEYSGEVVYEEPATEQGDG